MLLDKEVHWKWAGFEESKAVDQVKNIEEAAIRETLWRVMCFTNEEGNGKARVSQLVISFNTWDALSEFIAGHFDFLEIDYVAKTRRAESPAEFMMRTWNELSTRLGTVKMLNKERLARCRARWDEFPAPKGDFWEAAVKRANKSAFLAGSNDRAWVADFDFMIRPNSVAKVMEGKYDDRIRNAPGMIEGNSSESLKQLGWGGSGE